MSGEVSIDALFDKVAKSRSEARELGVWKYFTGKECPKGHVDVRIYPSGECLSCRNMRRKRQYAQNPEKFREQAKRLRANNLDVHRARARAYRLANKERVREENKKYREKYRAEISAKRKAAWDDEKRKKRREYIERNLERIKADVKIRGAIWKRENKERVRAHNRNRDAVKKAAEGRHTPEDVMAIRERQKDKCACCRIKLNGNGHVDHIIPLSRGGSNWPKNLQLLCAHCNCTKHARDPVEFMQSQGYLL
jgi:5-methylcytosine-specific restriction endonuclease McrA